MTEKELIENMRDPVWRLSSLYKITTKGDKDQDGLVVQFKPNVAQLKFIDNLHHRNIILKARQLGFTTLIAIIWLDHALFNPDSRCGIIAQDREAAEIVFRDKVKFAYDNLPEVLKAAMPLARDSASELLFAHNNSSIRVATSMRSGTIHRLHISEMGKICAKFPDKAAELVTGSIPAVPPSGVLIIESTSEGSEGEFYNMTQRAMKLKLEGKELTEKDYRFHFFPWYGEKKYTLNTNLVFFSEEDNEYFDAIEAINNVKINRDQRSWYIKTRDSDFSGSHEKMWQEYPSTPEEAFQQSVEGNYYSKQMAGARSQGRLRSIQVEEKPVHTFWDIGNSDGCAIWFMQSVAGEDRFIDYYEASGETLLHYMKVLQDKPYLYGDNFLPHDAGHKQFSDTNKSIADMLRDLGMKSIVIVPKISDITAGIQQTRDALKSVFIDPDRCKLGVSRLDNYKKAWDNRTKRWSNRPLHDANSEGADSFRQYAQAKANGMLAYRSRGVQATKVTANKGYVPARRGSVRC
jgi:hypothetical protein